jgi:hypothetical protein
MMSKRPTKFRHYAAIWLVISKGVPVAKNEKIKSLTVRNMSTVFNLISKEKKFYD